MARVHIKLKKLWQDVTQLTVRGKILIGAVLCLLVGVGFFVGTSVGESTTPPDETEEKRREVVLASVRELSQEAGSLVLIGEVSAVSEASVRAEAQGRVTQILAKNGDSVARGQIIMRIENSTQIAALRQAEAALASQQAAVNRNQNVTGVGLSNAQRTLQDAQASAINSLQAQHAQAREAVLSQADTLFSDPLSINPRLLFTIPTNQQEKNQLERQRLVVGQALISWGQKVGALTAEQLTSDMFRELETYADVVNDFLAGLSAAASSLQATATVTEIQIASWKSAASTARAQTAGIPAAMNGLETSIAQAETSLALAEEEDSQSSLGLASTAEASLRQAESAVRAAEVALAKTVVRSPISGVLSGLGLKVGDVIAPLQDVFVVSNSSALEVITYVTENEKEALVIGGPAYIGATRMPATITSIAPVVDPATRKIEVAVRPDTNADLIDGQSVSLRLQRSGVQPEVAMVPLSALKVLPEGYAVFELTEEGLVRVRPVEVGPISGARVMVRSGLDLDDVIITGARGLAVGDEVAVAGSIVTTNE